ncbi:mannose-1-phosphate guanylyltransferase/mannose-6-phosphate isomerase [Rhizorhapis sp. SPR117]|uniref:mannose-1-phosphate guanylyltransferase/mannose-6-phosphate isomerase n=1 Tax=Rhizorhapis sp. SPR117 TaxID=2912611 RepID=UPI001F00CD62|nr:mannose-1-phosphate guanylyltransferase/mannose-6-phosphate isomerase [Rhizorhapis sp. SPR117]
MTSAEPDTPLIAPVILSGGSGTRLWPLSLPDKPKQLLALTADESMIQLTVKRTMGRTGFASPLVVANARHADMIEVQLEDAGERQARLILEPVGRNTAPAIALAALAVDPATPLLVMPSDHVIMNLAAFHAAIQSALPLVHAGWLVTFGITPNAPETGYGYIKMGEILGDRLHRVERFVEKPGAASAQSMLAEGGYVWNAGIFLFQAGSYLDALDQYQPKMLGAAKAAMDAAQNEGRRIIPDATQFAACPADSIDYAVMEKAEQVAVVPVSMGWSDVGSWDSLHAAKERDEHGNACQGDIMAIDTHNCLIHSDGPRISLVGVEDLIVVASGNDILILPRGQSQDVRKVTDLLKKR